MIKSSISRSVLVTIQGVVKIPGFMASTDVIGCRNVTFHDINGMDGCVYIVSAVVLSVVVSISRVELVTIPGVVKIQGVITSIDVIGCGNVTFPGTNGMDGCVIVVSAVVISVVVTISKIELFTIPIVMKISGVITSTHYIGCRNVTFPGTNGMDGCVIVVSAVVVSFVTIWRIELVTIPGALRIQGFIAITDGIGKENVNCPGVNGMDGCVILVSEVVISVVAKISRIELVTIPGFVKIPGAITSPHVIGCGNVTFPGTNGMDGYLIVVSAVVISVVVTISRIELVTIPGIVFILGLSYPLT